MTTSLHPARGARASFLALGLLATLAGCGGGGGSSPAVTPTPVSGAEPASQALAQAASINTAVVPSDATEALALALSLAQASVSASTALSVSQTVACAGGGTATVTVAGGSLSSFANGQFDAGERYALSFNACRASGGSGSVDGDIGLTVVSASGDDFSVDTAASELVVTLPQRTVTPNGASSWSRHTVTSGTDAIITTTTDHWTAPSVTAVTRSGSRTSRFALTQVDLTRTVTRRNGSVTQVSNSGSSTLSAVLPHAILSLTWSSQGGVSYDLSGVPLDGHWSITLPHNTIALGVVAGLGTIQVDYGGNGSIDQTYTFTIGDLVSEAG